MQDSISKELLFLVNNYYDIVIVAVLLSLGVSFLVSKIAQGRVASLSNGHIPGRLGLPFVGETFAFMSAVNSNKGCYDFIRLRRTWYGKWFKTRIFGKIHVFVPSIEGAKTIFTNDFGTFNKGFVKSMSDIIGERSLLCVGHDSHKRIRRLLSDPFSMNSLSSFIEKFDNMLCQKLKKLEQSGKSFSVLDFTMKMTFDAMCCMLMSITNESLLRKLEKDCTTVSDGILSFPVMIPGTRYYRGIKARGRLMETFKEIIARRRSGNILEEYPEDFLQSMLRRDSYPPEEKLQDSEILDNLLTLIIAGQTTTSAALMWSVKFLHDNQQAQDILREEQLSISRSKPEGSTLTLEDINNMPYCWKVVKETTRMSTVVMWYPRVALSDCTIQVMILSARVAYADLLCDGYLQEIEIVDSAEAEQMVEGLGCRDGLAGFEIKKGWHVNVDATCIHYDPDLYADPTKFNPSRFDDLQKPYSFIPFGSGPRTCLGINMAKMTMMVFLHRLTSGYRWTVDDPDTSLEKKAHIPKLRSGCPITLKAI